MGDLMNHAARLYGLLRCLLCAWLVLAACTQEPQPPELRAVEPALVFNGAEVPIELVGERFYPSLNVNVFDRQDSSANAAFVLRLRMEQGAEGVELAEPVELLDVQVLSLQRLRATVPAGIEPGVYRLDLVSPYGETATLPSAVTVVDGRAAALSAVVDRVSLKVFEQAVLRVSLVDRVSQPVAQSWPVRVSLVGDAGASVSAAFEPGGLEGQRGVVVDGAVSIEGALGVDGVAEIAFTVAAPTGLTVRVEEASTEPRLSSDEARMQWLPGGDVLVRVERLRVGEPVVAGVPFPIELTLVDEYDNPLPGVVATVVVADGCSSWAELVEISGSVQVDALTRQVSGTERCPIGQVVVNNGRLGGSDTFEVLPGPVSRFEVDNNPLIVTAGGTFTAFVKPVDAFGNEAEWSGTLDAPQDSVGGVVSASCLGASGVRSCTLRVVRAGAGVVLEVTAAPNLQGFSRPYRVDAAAAEGAEVRLVEQQWVAGEPAAVQVRLVDAFGNPRDSSGLTAQGVVVSAGEGALGCVAGGETADAWKVFLCTPTAVTPSTRVQVQVAGLAVSAPTEEISVVNGPLASVEVVPTVSEVVAGAPFAVFLRGLDAHGNPYLVQDDASLAVSDTTGSLTPAVVTLGPDGTVLADFSVTVAGSTTLRALGVGAATGSSPPISVAPGSAEQLRVAVSAPWVWVNEATPISVQVVDAFGNRAPFAGPVEVRSSAGLGTPVTLQAVNGTALGNFRWSGASVADTLTASSGGLVGASPALLIVRGCGAAGPTAQLTLPAGGRGRYCVDPASGDALVAASMSASTPGAGPITVYGLRIAGVGGRTGSTPVQSLLVHRVGRYQLVGLAVQNDGCAAESSSEVYVGLPGLALGPFTVSLDEPTLEVGGPLQQSAVQITGVSDCAGALVSDTLRVRTDLGAIRGATPTGAGLVVQTDAQGAARLTLDLVGVRGGEQAEVYLGSLDGVASQRATAEVIGDLVLPEVWWQTPRGGTSTLVSTVRVGFSEPLDPASVDLGVAALTGPAPSAVSAVALSPDGLELTVSLSPAASPSLGAPWQLRLVHTLTDLAGNPLDGRWAGAPGDYLGSFGLSAAVDPVESCSRSTEVFRPDGDDGSGAEADSVLLSFQAASAPAWWVVSATDTQGVTHRVDYLVPLGAVDGWAWDGRDERGKVLPPGSYTLEVDAEGSQGNRGGACVRVVEIVQEGT